MRASFIPVAAFLALTAPNIHALAQQAQDKAKACNADAGGLTGDERDRFVANCLKANPSAAGENPQQKTQRCNAQASTQRLFGFQRHQFIANCLAKS